MTRRRSLALGVASPRRSRLHGTPPEDPGGGGGDIGDPRSAARIMFTGHSLMDNPLADDVEIIANNKSKTHDWQQQILIGSPIRVRTRGNDSDGSSWDGYAMGKNRSGNNLNLITHLSSPGTPYTDVVMAEHHASLEMLANESTIQYLRHFYALTRGRSPSVRPYFYATWYGYYDDGFNGVAGTTSNPALWLAHERKQLEYWEAVASRVDDTLAALGRTECMAVLPASGALAELVDQATSGNVPGITAGSVASTMAGLITDAVHLTTLGAYFMS